MSSLAMPPFIVARSLAIAETQVLFHNTGHIEAEGVFTELGCPGSNPFINVNFPHLGHLSTWRRQPVGKHLPQGPQETPLNRMWNRKYPGSLLTVTALRLSGPGCLSLTSDPSPLLLAHPDHHDVVQ